MGLADLTLAVVGNDQARLKAAAQRIMTARFGEGVRVVDMDYLDTSRQYRVTFDATPANGLPVPMEEQSVLMHELLVLEVATDSRYGREMLSEFARRHQEAVFKRHHAHVRQELNRELLRDEFSGDSSFEPRR